LIEEVFSRIYRRFSIEISNSKPRGSYILHLVCLWFQPELVPPTRLFNTNPSRGSFLNSTGLILVSAKCPGKLNLKFSYLSTHCFVLKTSNPAATISLAHPRVL